MPSVRSPCALALLVLAGCGAPTPGVLPNASGGAFTPRTRSGPAPFAEAGAANTAPRPVPSSMITHGTHAAELSKQPLPPGAPECRKSEPASLSFDHPPTYTEKVARDGTFSARLFVGNDASCTRKVSLPLSFTPPKSTATRTIELAAYIPPRGAFVDLQLPPEELAEANVTPGRYAITFAVVDDEGRAVGRALSGNAFRLGRDDVAITAAPSVPARIGIADDLVVPIAIENVGDTANRVTPLVVFTRPGETAGIEHYEPPQLVVPGASSLAIRLTPQAREAEGIAPGAWLVTVTMFDASGDRLNSFAGLTLAIGNIDVRMKRPELPTRIRSSSAIHARFNLENRGDTKEKITALVVFTKPGTTASSEFSFTREVAPGPLAFDAVIEPARLAERSIGEGVWLVSTAAFKSSGERIKSFTGHYLEIVE